MDKIHIKDLHLRTIIGINEEERRNRQEVFINLAYLSLGSNIEPERNLPAAVAHLSQFGRIKAVSNVWQTNPVGFTKQADFLNAAVLLETNLSAAALRRKAIAQIENKLGRIRTENKNGPRPIDIDIMLFNRDVFSMGWRRIPDPELLEQAHVAIPMAEIAPDYVHPENNLTLKEIAWQFTPALTIFGQRNDVKLLANKLLPNQLEN